MPWNPPGWSALDGSEVAFCRTAQNRRPYSVFMVFWPSRALQGAFSAPLGHPWRALGRSGPPLRPSEVVFGGSWVASTGDVVRSGDATQRNSAQLSATQPQRKSAQRSKLSSVLSIVEDLLIVIAINNIAIIFDRSTVAGLLLQLVGHVLCTSGLQMAWKTFWIGKLCGGLLGPSLGPLGASWARFGSHFPPPRWRRRLQEVIFGLFWDVPAESLNMRCCVSLFHMFGSFFYAIVCPRLPSLLRGRRRRAYAKKLKFRWFLWVASHMRLVLATPEAINFQGGRVINIGGKKSSKKGPTGPENKVKQIAFLRPKMAPKMDPGASRNVCTRRSATEAAKNASWGAPRAPPDDFGAIFIPDRYPGVIRHTKFRPPGPLGANNYQRNRLKTIQTQDQTRLGPLARRFF